MKQMIASWSMVMIRALLVAGSGIKPVSTRSLRLRDGRAPSTRIASSAPVLARGVRGWTVLGPKRLKREFISQLTGLGPFRCFASRTVVRGERASAWIVNRTRRGPFLTLCEVCEYQLIAGNTVTRCARSVGSQVTQWWSGGASARYFRRVRPEGPCLRAPELHSRTGSG